MTDQIKLRSKIPADLIKETLFRGSILASIGASLLLYGSVRLSVQSLAIWGPWLFGVGILFIIVGMVPYRRLSRLQGQPDELLVDQQDVHLRTGGKLLFSIPLHAIEKVSFVAQPKAGIALQLKRAPSQRVRVYCKSFNMTRFEARNQKSYGFPLFFPHFTHRACEELEEILASL
jgi:hypothetical protein